MIDENPWRWKFLAFESVWEGRPVQVWFDPIPEDDKWEITDLLDALQKVTSRLWPGEVFDPLKGEGGISEIKIPNIRCFREGKVKIVTYRIYGYFGPYRQCYTFLHGTDKDVKNDTVGKEIAKRRLHQLRQYLGTGRVSVYKFEFEEQSDSKTAEGKKRPQ